MANLVWQNKNSSKPTPSLSPRQVANKAYSLACKKLDRDLHRGRPHYDVRERLLLYTTMCKAETVLHKPHTQRCSALIADDDDVMRNPQSQPSKPASAPPDPSSTAHAQPVEIQDQAKTNISDPMHQSQLSHTQAAAAPQSYCPLIPQDCRLPTHHGASNSLLFAPVTF